MVGGMVLMFQTKFETFEEMICYIAENIPYKADFEFINGHWTLNIISFE